MIKNNVVLVTGGAGYIGSMACKFLAEQGITPVVYDNLIYGHKEFVQWGPFEQGDILDAQRLSEVFTAHKPCAVFHFAGFGYVGESVQKPAKYYQNNIIGTYTLLDTMLKHKVKNIVFSSTCATYGYPDSLPIVEDMVQSPVNPYGQTKLCIEKMLYDYDCAYGLKSIILRYFNAAGADPEGQIGEDHDPECHLIPLVLDVALGKREKITILGNDYATQDGTCVRDYVHIADLASAHWLALDYLIKHEESNLFNLGIGTGFSVKQVIAAAQKVSGVAISIAQESRRSGDPDILVADAMKARDILGWKPEYTQIEEVIEHAWQWHKSRFSSKNSL